MDQPRTDTEMLNGPDDAPSNLSSKPASLEQRKSGLHTRKPITDDREDPLGKKDRNKNKPDVDAQRANIRISQTHSGDTSSEPSDNDDEVNAVYDEEMRQTMRKSKFRLENRHVDNRDDTPERKSVYSSLSPEA